MGTKNRKSIPQPKQVIKEDTVDKFVLPFKPIYLFIGLLALCIIQTLMLTFNPVTCNDFWLQIKVGEIIYNTGSIPKTALFPFTEAKDYPLVAHEWFPSLLFYLFSQVLQYSGFIFLKGFFGLVHFMLIFVLVYQSNKNKIISLGISMMVLVAINYRHFMRPEIFSTILLLAHLILLNRYMQTRQQRWLFSLIPLTIVWANFHGSYLLALIFIPAFAAGDLLDSIKLYFTENIPFTLADKLREYAPLIMTFFSIFLAILINPYGPNILVHSWTLSQSAWMKNSIFEWNPTFSPAIVGKPFYYVYLVYLCLLGLAVIIGRKNLRGRHIIVLLMFGYLSVQAQRHIAVFALATAFIPAELLRDKLSGIKQQTIFAGIAALLLVFGSYRAYTRGNINQIPPGLYFKTPFSKEALEFIEKNKLEGNVLNSYALGSQLIYHFYPKLKIAIDSRIDVYGENYYKLYSRLFVDKRYLKDFIDRYQVKYVIIKYPEFFDFPARDMLVQLNFKPIFNDQNILIIARE